MGGCYQGLMGEPPSHLGHNIVCWFIFAIFEVKIVAAFVLEEMIAKEMESRKEDRIFKP